MGRFSIQNGSRQEQEDWDARVCMGGPLVVKTAAAGPNIFFGGIGAGRRSMAGGWSRTSGESAFAGAEDQGEDVPRGGGER